jgi:hypothetical protein
MITGEQAKTLGTRWLESWNAHDLEAIVAQYADNAAVVSPVAVKLLNEATGEVRGKAAVRAYFAKCLEAYPYLNFQMISAFAGVSSVGLYYVNHKGTRTCEVLELDAKGKIVRDVANYLV